MASPSEIRHALAGVLAEVPGLAAFAESRESAPATLPAALVQPAAATFGSIQAGRGQDVWEFEVLILVSGADSAVAQEQLEEYLAATGPKSVRAAVAANPHLGLDLRTTAWVDRMDNYGPRISGGEHTRHFGAVLHVIVRTSD